MTASSIDIAGSHKTRIGCSKIAQALGVSRFGTAYELWERYTGRAPWPDLSGDLRVALGEPMEDVLRPFVAARLGRELRRDRREYLHPKIPLIGHVDYRASRLAGEAQRPVVDMKTSLGFGARHRFGEDGTDAVDDDVLLQMQGYLMLTGAETAHVAALVPGPELKIYTLAADAQLHGLIESGLSEFWRCVTSDAPPHPHSEVEARQRWARHLSGKVIEADSELVADIRSLARLKRQLAELEKAQQAIRDRVISRLADADAVLHEGVTLLTYRANRDQPRTDWRGVADALEAPAELIAAHTATVPGARVLRLGKELPA